MRRSKTINSNSASRCQSVVLPLPYHAEGQWRATTSTPESPALRPSTFKKRPMPKDAPTPPHRKSTGNLATGAQCSPNLPPPHNPGPQTPLLLRPPRHPTNPPAPPKHNHPREPPALPPSTRTTRRQSRQAATALAPSRSATRASLPPQGNVHPIDVDLRDRIVVAEMD